MEAGATLNADFVVELEVDNKTMFYYAFKNPPVLPPKSELEAVVEYDQQGAMYFAVAVILLYGVSIALLIGSTLRKRDHDDYEVKSFLRGYAKLDRQEKKRVKQKTRMTLLERNLLPIFPGCSFAATPNVFKKPATEVANLACISPVLESTENTISPLTDTALTDEFSVYLDSDDGDVFDSATDTPQAQNGADRDLSMA